jgi:hypothetical protein
VLKNGGVCGEKDQTVGPLGRHEYDRLSEQGREKRVQPIEEKIDLDNVLASN